MPFEVRYVFAKVRGQLMADWYIANTAGLSKYKVREFSKAKRWDDFLLCDIQKFCDACGFDPLRQSEALKHLKRIADEKIKLTHLNEQQRKRFTRLYAGAD
jgi:hypothetical protein